MADFRQALSFTLQNEGGLQKMAGDRGNQQADGSISSTNRGVTLGTLKLWRKSQNRPEPTDADVVKLSLDETAQIYDWLCWDPVSGDRLSSQFLATILFDSAVLCGTLTAARMLQQIVAACGVPLLADGNLGPKSVAAINGSDAATLAHMLVDRHSDRFSDIVLADFKQAPFLAGWRVRRSKWRQLILAD